ncbi:DUF3596 domain-containing protein [Chitinophaga sp.]|uniref:Arm DNA-binding domain-containing protein n=1 Tax=Chitinophaga sp. TaxID=1869181 RepID=UPI0031DF0B95
MGRKISQTVTISFLDDRGKIRLRFRYNGQRYTLFTSIDYDKPNLKTAKRIGKAIKADIDNETFDTSLERYRDSILCPLFSQKRKRQLFPL